MLEPFQSAGNCELPEGAPWLEETVKEYGDFPEGANDDEVDCGAMAAVALGKKPPTMADAYSPEDELAADDDVW